VVHDELDINPGTAKIKFSGGHGGHNGLKSIDSVIGKDYIRIRMGIGKPEHRSQVSDFVLSDFNIDESRYLEKWIEYTTLASKAIINGEGLENIKSKYTIKDIKALSI